MSKFGYQTLGFGAGGKKIIFTVAKGVGGNTETDGTADGDYKYHVFDSSGTFTVTTLGTDATVEYMILGGGAGGSSGVGGGGSAHAGGGGGAGGYLAGTHTVSASGYTCLLYTSPSPRE